jgi:hypothetical protein
MGSALGTSECVSVEKRGWRIPARLCLCGGHHGAQAVGRGTAQERRTFSFGGSVRKEASAENSASSRKWRLTSKSMICQSLCRRTSLCFFRVLQEALHNSTKHSGIRYFEVELWERRMRFISRLASGKPTNSAPMGAISSVFSSISNLVRVSRSLHSKETQFRTLTA